MSQYKKKIRTRFREEVFKRDNYTCTCCPRKDGLDAHHITDRNELPNGGYVLENGITLCPSCHRKAELWHESRHTDYVRGYHPTDLYAIIGSSLLSATRASEKLK